MASVAAAGWTARAVPNMFPVLEARSPVTKDPCHASAPGYGFHELIIESDRHDADLVTMADEEVAAALSMYKDRIKHLLFQERIEAVVLFRNYGLTGGASQAHPHAQLIALEFVPARLRGWMEWGRRYSKEKGRCPTCEEIEIEQRYDLRIIGQTGSYIALVPFAAEVPCELWILPKHHQASFLELADTQLPELAGILRHALRALRDARDDPAYNLVLDTAPREQIASTFLHWRMRIIPRTERLGGFELGAGIMINASLPEDDAAALRAALQALSDRL